MTRTQLRARRSVIVSRLADMARDGWRNATANEYQPLEKELAEIDVKLGNAPSRRGAQRNADRIDGYDRDDLGESPDF